MRLGSAGGHPSKGSGSSRVGSVDLKAREGTSFGRFGGGFENVLSWDRVKKRVEAGGE